MERVPGAGQLPGVDELVADPSEVFATVADHQARLFPTPTLASKNVQVGAEDVVEAPRLKAPLPILVQHRKGRPETNAASVGAQDTAAQPMDGADADPRQISHVTGVGGQGDETLTQFTGRSPRVSAEHQLLRSGQIPQQDVRAAQRHRQGLSGAGTGDAPRGAVQMADEFQLTPVQSRVPAQNGGRYARFVVHVGFLLIWLID